MKDLDIPDHHAHVPLCPTKAPDATLHEVVEPVGITGRATHGIVDESVREDTVWTITV